MIRDFLACACLFAALPVAAFVLHGFGLLPL